MWVIDIPTWLNQEGADIHDLAIGEKIEKIKEIVAHATSSAIGNPVGSPPRCWRRFEGKACKGDLVTRLDQSTDQIYWKCSACDDEGVITGWRDLVQGSIRRQPPQAF